MKMILKTHFKMGKIMRKIRGVQKEEGSVHQRGHVRARLRGLDVVGLLMVV